MWERFTGELKRDVDLIKTKMVEPLLGGVVSAAPSSSAPPDGDYRKMSGAAAPAAGGAAAGAESGRISCTGCQSLLSYPIGAHSIKCPLCQTLMQTGSTAAPEPAEQELLVRICPSCKTAMKFPVGSQQVQCPTCSRVNAVEAMLGLTSQNDASKTTDNGSTKLVYCGACRASILCPEHYATVSCPGCQHTTDVSGGAPPTAGPSSSAPPTGPPPPQTQIRCESCGTQLLAPAGSPVVMCPLCRGISRVPPSSGGPAASSYAPPHAGQPSGVGGSQPLRPQQPLAERELVQQFKDVTGANDLDAFRFLEANSWEVERAINSFLCNGAPESPLKHPTASASASSSSVASTSGSTPAFYTSGSAPAYSADDFSNASASTEPVLRSEPEVTEPVTWKGVADWLDSIDLGKYKDAFLANEVNELDTLLEMSDADLKELDVALGARRKMLFSMRTLAAAKKVGLLVRAEES